MEKNIFYFFKVLFLAAFLGIRQNTLGYLKQQKELFLKKGWSIFYRILFGGLANY